MKNCIHLIVCLLIPFLGYSQLGITINSSATSLAQNIVGSGITISNATILSGANSTGIFTYTGTQLGIPNGVLLTNGHAVDADNPGSYFCNVTNGNNLTDADVTAISPQARYDACILQFDFMPTCDTLRITYVFGSEEYPKYINQYNDVFAIFLSGPNPAGGNYNAQNIATLPNGITPVSIFTVNGGWPIGTGASNPAYYVDNYTTPNSDIAYDGYTVPITSSVAVTPCQMYHMKIAVVDAGNGKYDSGVFIQGNTFTCNNAPTESIATTPACSNNGTATASISNYSGTPTYLWTPGGQTTSSITNLTAGTYTCIVSFPGMCLIDTLTAVVASSLPTVNAMAAATICIGQTVTLSANSSGGTPAYSYSWTDGINPVGTTVSPSVSTTYNVVATDASGCSSSPDSVRITVNPPLSIQTASQASICEGDSTQLNSIAAGGNGNYSYSWSPSIGLDNSTLSNPMATPATTTTYTVTVTDNCGTPSVSSGITINVSSKPIPVIAGNNLSGCIPLCVNFFENSLTSCSNELWTFGDGQSTTGCGSASHCYQTPGTYSVATTVTNTTGCIGTSTINNFVTVFPQPLPKFIYSPNPTFITDPKIVFTDKSYNATYWFWTFDDLTDDTSLLKNPVHTYKEVGCYNVKLIVKSNLGCVDSTTTEICVNQEFEFYAPNSFTPNGDGINDVFTLFGTGVNPNNYELLIFDRWGSLIYKTNEWGQGWNGYANGGAKISQQDTYVWQVLIYDKLDVGHNFTGKVTLIK